MWSDNEAEIDLLNVVHLVQAVCRLATDEALDPVTIGVYGAWGSGKSSVVSLVRRQLDARDDTLTVYFNGWKFEGYEDAKSALASSILEGIEQELAKEGGKLAAVKSTIGGSVKQFWARVDTLRFGRKLLGAGVDAGIAAGAAYAAGAASGSPVPGALAAAAMLGSLVQQGKKIDGEAVASLVKEQKEADDSRQRDVHKSVREFHRDFAELVQKLGLKRIVVIVDDLDRCLPTNVIETLEAIRLFLAVPKTAFIIAADESQIREAVSIRFPSSTSESDETGRVWAATGTRYLEKLIQVPVHIPPLSHADIHGYLNLLFAQSRESDIDRFKLLCDRVRASGSYDSISFSMTNAEEFLGRPVPPDLAEDLSLAEHIAPVLALCSEGNPRQVKRFLNAMVLRLALAADRGVKLDRGIAAKLLVLEYFLPSLFRSLALEAAANEGISAGLAQLEATASKDATSDAAAQPTSHGTFLVEAASMQASERFRAWLGTQPLLHDQDLRKYIYFANARFALPLGVSARLTPSGAAVLRDLLSDSESVQSASAQRSKGLSVSELIIIIDQLATSARNDRSDLTGRASPLQALVKVAQETLGVAPEVIAAIVGLPINRLPASVAPLVDALSSHDAVKPAVASALQHWAKQTTNKALQAGAKQRLEKMGARTNTGRGR